MFEPDDAILNQLINSGALRCFKSIKLQKSIGRLNVAISNIKKRNDQEFSYAETYTCPFAMHHFDFNWQDDFTQNGKISILNALSQKNFHSNRPPVIKNIDDFKRKDAAGLTAFYLMELRGTRQIHYSNFLVLSPQL